MAIFFAVIIAIVAVAIAIVQVFADGMRVTPTYKSGAGMTLLIGFGIAALVAAYHWW